MYQAMPDKEIHRRRRWRNYALGGVLLALVLKKSDGRPIIIGMATSLAAMLAIKYGLKEAIHWPWYTAIGCGITLLVALLANAAIVDQGKN